LPVAYFLGKICGYGGEGLWAGLTFGILVSAVYLVVRFHKLCARVDFKTLFLTPNQ
jgi:Na+-driven multidrug efflux pump